MLNKKLFKSGLTALAIAVSTAYAPSSAAVSPYSQDFEALLQTDPLALANDGWLVGANVFDPAGTTYLYNYFPFPAPNGGPAFSGIDTGQGGVPQGAQQMVVYNDYNNADHNIGYRIEAVVFQEQAVTAADVGDTWTFSYDTKAGNIADASNSTALAFIQTINPADNYSLSGSDTATTGTSISWGSNTLSLTIGADQLGHLFQFGFRNTASNFESAGVFYDNLCLDKSGGSTCPGSSLDTDGDSVNDDDDLCPDTAPGDPVDAAGCSDAQVDGDGDGACDPGAPSNGPSECVGTDACAATVIPESVPTVKLGTNRWALEDDGFEFDTTAPKGKGPGRSYSTADTVGCSCEQIIGALELGNGHKKFGCSISAMDEWVALPR